MAPTVVRTPQKPDIHPPKKTPSCTDGGCFLACSPENREFLFSFPVHTFSRLCTRRLAQVQRRVRRIPIAARAPHVLSIYSLTAKFYVCDVLGFPFSVTLHGLHTWQKSCPLFSQGRYCPH